MPGGFLRIRFVNGGDGSGELIAHAAAEDFSGTGRAYFNIEEIERFASAIAAFPISNDVRPAITGGFYGTKSNPGELDQEHLGISVYPIDSRGHLGIHVRMATQVQSGDRPESQESASVEIKTTYEPLARFSRELVGVLRGNSEEAVLIGDQ